jgi:hypothetical protein
LVCDNPAGDGKIANLFIKCTDFGKYKCVIKPCKMLSAAGGAESGLVGKGRAREMAEEALGLLKHATAILQVHTLIKKKTKFSSYIRKFRWEQLQSCKGRTS